MCNYEMDLTSNVEDTERTRFCPQTDGQGETSIPPFQLLWRGRYNKSRAHFLSLARSKLRLCSANHRAGYFSNLACDWLSIVWAYSEQVTENGPRTTIHWRYCSIALRHQFYLVPGRLNSYYGCKSYICVHIYITDVHKSHIYNWCSQESLFPVSTA